MLALACEVFKMNTYQTVRQLEQLGFIESTRNLDQQLAKRKRHLTEWFSRANDILKEAVHGGRWLFDPGAVALASNLYLSVESGLSWNIDGIGKCVGYLTAERMEQLVRAKDSNEFVRYTKRTVVPGSSGGVLLVPYYDAPGRVCGFNLIASGHNRQWHEAFWSVPYLRDGKPYLEGGISMHPQLVNSKEPVLLLDNLRAGLKFWTRWYSRNPNPPPVALYRAGYITTTNWGLLRGHQCALWSSSITPEILSCAIKNDIQIATSGPKRDSILDYFRNNEPDFVVNSAKKSIRSWQEVTQRLIAEKEVDSLADFFSQTDLTPEQQTFVIDSCPPSTRDKCQKALGLTVVHKTVSDGHGVIEQNPSGIYYRRFGKNPELIINAPFKILTVIKQNSALGITSLSYEVEVLYANNKVTFVVPKDVFEKNPLGCINETLIERNLGFVTFNKRFSSKVLQFITQLYPPKIVDGVNKVGYEPQNNRILTPVYGYDPQTGAREHVKSCDNDLPLSGKPYNEHDTVELELLLEKMQPVHWGAYLCLLRQILAPAAGFKPRKIFLHGFVAELAMVDVCYGMKLPTITFKNTSMVKLRAIEHAVPAFISNYGISSRFKQELISQDEVPLIIPTSVEQQYYGLVNQSADILQSPREQQAARINCDAISELTDYLIHYICKRGELTRFVSDKKAMLNITLRAIGNITDKHNLNATVSKYFRMVGNSSTDFIDCVVRFIGVGRLKLIEIDSEADIQPMAVCRINNSSKIFVDRNDLFNCFRQAGFPHMDPTDLSMRLLDGSPAIQTAVLMKHVGWYLPAKEFELAINRLKVSANPHVSIPKMTIKQYPVPADVQRKVQQILHDRRKGTP